MKKIPGIAKTIACILSLVVIAIYTTEGGLDKKSIKDLFLFLFIAGFLYTVVVNLLNDHSVSEGRITAYTYFIAALLAAQALLDSGGLSFDNSVFPAITLSALVIGSFAIIRKDSRSQSISEYFHLKALPILSAVIILVLFNFMENIVFSSAKHSLVVCLAIIPPITVLAPLILLGLKDLFDPL